MVFCGLVIAWRFAGSPTLRSPFFKKATIDGVVRRPSSFAITTGSLPSITDTQELVVPKSIPIIFAIIDVLSYLQFIFHEYLGLWQTFIFRIYYSIYMPTGSFLKNWQILAVHSP